MLTVKQSGSHVGFARAAACLTSAQLALISKRASHIKDQLPYSVNMEATAAHHE